MPLHLYYSLVNLTVDYQLINKRWFTYGSNLVLKSEQ